MEKNAIIAAVLAMAVLLGWQYFVIQPMEQRRVERQKKEALAKKAVREKAPPVTSAPLQAQAPAPAAPEKEAGPAPLPVVSEKEEQVRVDVGDAVYTFTSRGAGLVSARLKKYLEDDGKPLELIPAAGPDLRPLYFMGSEQATRLNGVSYRVEGGDLRLTPAKPEGELRFRYRGPDGLAAEKVFAFRHNHYGMRLKVFVTQPDEAGPLGLVLGPRLWGGEQNSYGGVVEGPMSDVSGKLLYDAPEEGKPIRHPEGLRWTALQTKYFIAALVPRAGAASAEIRLLPKVGKENRYAVVVPLAEGPRTEAAFDLFVGPKEVDRLSRFGVGLEGSLDYGYFGFISRPLMAVLRVLHAVAGNWGVAIILLTVLIKLLFYPLTHVSMRNMREMQKLQPKMAQIREIYKDDRGKMNEQVMALYKEHKVNPMMGCLPMVIQIPVFFGLYNALLVSIELRNAPFFWWITDLSRQDPYHVYTLLMGASMFVQQRMTPTAGDPTQAKMMMFMPIVFTGMFIWYPVPVGLVIYWLVNNVLSIVQQYFVNRSVKVPKLAEES